MDEMIEAFRAGEMADVRREEKQENVKYCRDLLFTAKFAMEISFVP